jgi:hypothetical protein
MKARDVDPSAVKVCPTAQQTAADRGPGYRTPQVHDLGSLDKVSHPTTRATTKTGKAGGSAKELLSTRT